MMLLQDIRKQRSSLGSSLMAARRPSGNFGGRENQSQVVHKNQILLSWPSRRSECPAARMMVGPGRASDRLQLHGFFA